MKIEQKTVFILTEEEYRAFDKVSDIIKQICNKQKGNGEQNGVRPCAECPCFLACETCAILENMEDFFDCRIECK